MFLVFEQMQAKRELKRLDEEIVSVQAGIDELKDQRVEELIKATEIVDSVKARAIVWSKVLRKLNDLTPVGVFFRSYGGSETGDLEISGLGDTYENVADVIRILDASEDFGDVFVPSIAVGTTTDGQQVVSFGLQVKSLIQ